MENMYKEVYFNQFCQSCKFEEKKEEEDPCYDCLAEPMNVHSHRPVKWEEK